MRNAAGIVRTLLITCTAAASGLIALMPAAANAAPKAHARSVTVKGTFEHLVVDGRGKHADLERDVVVAGSKSYTVKLPKGVHGKPGSAVTVTGTVSGSTLSATQFAAQPSGTKTSGGKKSGGSTTTTTTTPTTTTTLTAPTSPAAHVDRVLVILATWTQPDSVTQASATEQFFTTDNAWFYQSSYGAYGITGDVTPWVTIAGPTNGMCLGDSTSVLSQAQSAALALGFDSATYDRTVVYFPGQATGDCSGFAGWSYQPGKVVWLNGAMDTRTTVHEQGHNLGLGHAHALVCQNADGSYSTYGSGCMNNEYGDPYDAMGASNYAADFSAAMKAKLGWDAGRGVDLTNGGSAVVAPLEATTGTSYVTVTTGTDVLYVERRSSAGLDGGLPATATGGLLVHDLSSTGEVSLLDMSPDNDFSCPELAFNHNWQLPDGRWLNVGSDSAAGVPVSVTATPTDVAAPGEVTKVGASVHKGQLTMSWVDPTDPDLAAVTVRITRDGTDPRVSGTPLYSGLGTSVVTTAPGSTPLRFVIMTVDAAGNLSPGVAGSINSRGAVTLG